MANTTGKKFGGRKKGTPNKTTAAVKEAILEAFDQAGGVKYLLNIAHEDPRTFCTLLGKVLPNDIKADLTNSDGSFQPLKIEFVGINGNSSDTDTK